MGDNFCYPEEFRGSRMMWIKDLKEANVSSELKPFFQLVVEAEPPGLLLRDGTCVPLGSRLHSTQSLTGEMLSRLSQDASKS